MGVTEVLWLLARKGYDPCSDVTRNRWGTPASRHVFKCNRVPYTFSNRHQLLKTGFAQALRETGIGTSVEPNYVTYADNRNHRPDLAVFAVTAGIHQQSPYENDDHDADGNVATTLGVMTDFCICVQEGEPGTNARRKAEEKTRQHRVAVTAAGYTFIPYCLEVHGVCDMQCNNFIRACTNYVPRYMSNRLRMLLKYATSVSLALARVQTVLSLTAQQHVWQFEEVAGDECLS